MRSLHLLLLAASGAALALPAPVSALTPADGAFMTSWGDGSGGKVRVSFAVRDGRVEDFFPSRGLRCVRRSDGVAQRPMTIRGPRFSGTTMRGAFTVSGAQVTGDRFRVVGRFTGTHAAAGRMRFEVRDGRRRCDSGWVRWRAWASEPVSAAWTTWPATFAVPGDLTAALRIVNGSDRPSAGTVLRVELTDPRVAPGVAAGTVTSTQGTCTPAAGTEVPATVCRLGTLAGNGSVTVRVVQRWSDPAACVDGATASLSATFETALNGGPSDARAPSQVIGDVERHADAPAPRCA